MIFETKFTSSNNTACGGGGDGLTLFGELISNTGFCLVKCL